MATLNMQPHAIVDERKISTSFAYHGVMMPSLRLYSELLLCPQSLHYYYAIFYGKNQASATRPPAFKGKPLWETPQEFASNKVILDLTPRDRAAVCGELNRLSDDIKFTIKTFQDDSRAETTLDNNTSRLSTSCTIAVSQSPYDHLADPKLTNPQRLMIQFYVAVVLLHETAHAATDIHMGSKRVAEGFFEDSLIAEAGYEATSRIFGLEPYMPILNLRSSNSSKSGRPLQGARRSGQLCGERSRKSLRDRAKQATQRSNLSHPARLPDDPNAESKSTTILTFTSNAPTDHAQRAQEKTEYPRYKPAPRSPSAFLLLPKKLAQEKKDEEDDEAAKDPSNKPAGKIFDTKSQTPLDPRIHPLFQPSNFPPELDYTRAFARAAPRHPPAAHQAVHALVLRAVVRQEQEEQSAVVVQRHQSPGRAGRVRDEWTHWRIDSGRNQSCGERIARARKAGEVPEGQQGCASLIVLGHELYHAVRRERRPVQRDLLDYMLALTMVHELGHAAHSHLLGERCEDFCGGALIAEAGFDYMHALFGAMPVVRLGRSGSRWLEVCRDVRGLREEAVWVGMEGSYVRDLHDDAWWAREGERCQDVVYWRVACEPFEATLPSSFRHWICGEPGDEDDPEVKYAWADNPSLELRSLAPADEAPLEVDLPLDDEISKMPTA
ncbi:hypothetical protein Q7P37_008648 [Cladosporium fusiforme]